MIFLQTGEAIKSAAGVLHARSVCEREGESVCECVEGLEGKRKREIDRVRACVCVCVRFFCKTCAFLSFFLSLSLSLSPKFIWRIMTHSQCCKLASQS